MLGKTIFISLKQSGMHFVVTTTQRSLSPSLAQQFLTETARVFQDYCGILNEESIRKNFILIYELLDEIMVFEPFSLHPYLSDSQLTDGTRQDNGHIQTTNSEQLKAFIREEATLTDETSLSPLEALKVVSKW